MPDLKIPPVLKWIGGIAALLTASATAWIQFGGGVPITKHSPVVEALHAVDRDYKGAFQIQELETRKIQSEIDAIKIESLYNRIESNGILLTQFDGRANLEPGEIREKVRWETQIRKYEAQIDRLEARE